jgi:hypothetical protein
MASSFQTSLYSAAVREPVSAAIHLTRWPSASTADHGSVAMHEAVTEESIQKANGLVWEQMLAMPMHPIAQAEWDANAGTTKVRSIGAEHVLGSC